MLIENLKDDEYKITNFSPYQIHQRLAPKMRVGRFFLAGDSTHLCNPFGGISVASSLVDVSELFDCLVGIHDDGEDTNICNKYYQVRREDYEKLTNVISESFLKRMKSDPDKVEATNPGIVAMQETDKRDQASVAF
ncbi:FAD binding domain-containing protein [Stemphylium lycopersici]|uniref:FAD binding domain-containing protein n=1 Tax=Stemphylium lycopersici TaxID=183478 RepID=A0A364MWW4_STELY|nr:FAD binding domain-containing protein [Stemphylium lycopersici]